MDESRAVSGPVSDEERQKILELYRANTLIKEIAAQTGRPVGTVSTVIRRAREKPGQELGGLRKADRALTVEFGHDRGASLLRVATYCLLNGGLANTEDVATRVGLQQSTRLNERVLAGATAADDTGPPAELVHAVQASAWVSGRLGHGDALPYLEELSQELGLDRRIERGMVPASWLQDLSSTPVTSTTGAYAVGEAVFSYLGFAPEDRIEDLIRANADDVRFAVEALYDVAVQSPRVGSRAVHLLGRLGRVALDPSGFGSKHLRDVLYESPLGFRAGTIVSRVILEAASTKAAHAASLHGETVKSVRALLKHIEQEEPDALYPQRSYQVEVLFNVPDEWKDIEEEYVIGQLRRRALGESGRSTPDSRHFSKTFREQAFAATVLASRAWDKHADAYEEVLESFRARPDAEHTGYDYAVRFIEAVRRMGPVKGGRMPEPPQLPEQPAEVARVSEMLAEVLGASSRAKGASTVPPRARNAVTTLLTCALTDCHGTRRRRAMDCLRHAGLGWLLTEVTLRIAEDDTQMRWFRAQAAFAASAGYQVRSIPRLLEIAERAVEEGAAADEIAIAALHSAGDVGIRPDRDVDALESLKDIRTRHAERDGTDDYHADLVHRAITYALATVRTEDKGVILRYGEVLQLRLSPIPTDELDYSLAMWGIARLEQRREEVPRRVPSAIPREVRLPAHDRPGSVPPVVGA